MSQNNKNFTSTQCFNAKNERIKHRYFKYLAGARQKSVKSVDQARKCIIRIEECKAWSQNLGHENVSTTFGSYGIIDVYRQGSLIKKVGK